MSLSDQLVPVADAARAYGRKRSEVAMVALTRAVLRAVDGVGIDYATEEFTRAEWLGDLVTIATTTAQAETGIETRAELERRIGQ